MAPTGTALINGPTLLVAAAPAEARAVAAGCNAAAPDTDWSPAPLRTGWDLVRCGVGKVNAAACVVRCLAQRPDYTTILSIGVCGSLPAIAPEVPVPVGAIVVATASIYADEGVLTPGGYKDMSDMGFEPWPGAARCEGTGASGCAGVAGNRALVDRVASALAGLGLPVVTGAIATVSTCSGTDELAMQIAARTGAVAEAMEGAAIGHALRRMGSPATFLELRVVSNTTGDRQRQVWDLKGALATLTRAVCNLDAHPTKAVVYEPRTK